MAKKIKAASPYLLILVLIGMLIGFNLIGSDYWKLIAEAEDTDNLGTSVSVGNVAPVVSAVELAGNPRGADSITLVEGTDIDIVVSATVTDSTCADINGGGVKAYLYISSASWEYGVGTTCSWDYNDCYIPEARGGNIDCVQNDCSGGVAHYDCTASATADGMWYHASPTDTTASYSAETWYAWVIASDSAGADHVATSSVAVEVNLLPAIALSNGSDSLAYGPIAPGAESADTIARGVENVGNRGINITIESTEALDNATFGNIATQQQQYGTSDFEIGSGTSLSADPVELDLELPKPQTHIAGDNDDQIFWGIAIPAATSAGLYSGQTTYSTITD